MWHFINNSEYDQEIPQSQTALKSALRQNWFWEKEGNYKLRKKTKIRNRYIQVPHLTQDTIWKSEKTQENIEHKRSKRLALSQQVTTMLKATDKTVWLRQTRNTNYKKDPQKHCRTTCYTSTYKWVISLNSIKLNGKIHWSMNSLKIGSYMSARV